MECTKLVAVLCTTTGWKDKSEGWGWDETALILVKLDRVVYRVAHNKWHPLIFSL